MTKTDLPGQSPGSHYLQQPTLHYNDPTRLHSTWSDEYPLNPLDQQDARRQVYGVVGDNSLSLSEAHLGVRSRETYSQVNPLALYYTSPIGEWPQIIGLVLTICLIADLDAPHRPR
jgi:hypothetical protein